MMAHSGDPCPDPACSAGGGEFRVYCTFTVGRSRVRYLRCNRCLRTHNVRKHLEQITDAPLDPLPAVYVPPPYSPV